MGNILCQARKVVHSLEDNREEPLKGLGSGGNHNQNCILEESPRKECRKPSWRGQDFSRGDKLGGLRSNPGI